MKNNWLILLLFSIASYSQEIVGEQLPLGEWSQWSIQQKGVSRYFLVGAQGFLQDFSTPAESTCERSHTCSHRRRRRKNSCTQYYCYEKKSKMELKAISQIKGTYSHFQQNQNIITLGGDSNGTSLGLKVCPKNQYIYGLRVKTNPKSQSVSALNFYCRNPKNIRSISQISIFNGQGVWGRTYLSSNYAIGLSLKKSNGMVTGIRMMMNQIPMISSFELTYKFPKDFNVFPETIDNVVINNNGGTTLKKEIEMNRKREFKRIWLNQDGSLHGIQLSQFSSIKLVLTSSFGVPVLSSTGQPLSQKRQFSQVKRQDLFEKLVFGHIQTFKIGQRYKDIIDIPPCTRYTIKQIVYVSNADIPYTLKIGYTNGAATEYQNINGFYRGVSTTEIQNNVDYVKIC